MAEYILAHELGTSGDKATLFGTDGKMIGSRTCPYDIYYDQPLLVRTGCKCLVECCLWLYQGAVILIWDFGG